jgi:hypothetical protein
MCGQTNPLGARELALRLSRTHRVLRVARSMAASLSFEPDAFIIVSRSIKEAFSVSSMMQLRDMAATRKLTSNSAVPTG